MAGQVPHTIPMPGPGSSSPNNSMPYNAAVATGGYGVGGRGVARPNKPILGNSKKCCCCIFTKDAHHSLFLAFFVVFPVVVFNTSVIPPSEWYSILITSLLTVAALVILVCAVGIDPGIVPPASVTGHPCNPNEYVTITYEGRLVETRVCPTCLVPRPPRSSHCPVCDYCVEEYDHHCGVLGSCVAKRTFRFFAYFFDCTALLAGYIFARSVAVARDLSWSSNTNWTRWQAVAVLGCIIYTAITGCCVAGQAIWYTKLACDGLTQKDLYGRDGLVHQRLQGTGGTVGGTTTTQRSALNPVTDMSRASCGNYCTRKCAPLPPSVVTTYVV